MTGHPGGEGQLQEPAAGGQAGRAAGAARRAGGLLLAAVAGCREPVVIILVLISYFTVISGKPLDGVLLLAVAAGLAWDAGQRRRSRAGTAAGRGAGGAPASGDGIAGAGPAAASPPAAAAAGEGAPVLAAAGEAAAGPAAMMAGWLTGGQTPATRRGWLLSGAGLAGGALYAVLVGSFARYSWPATIAVVVLGAAVVGRGWRGPMRSRPDSGPLPLAGAALWGAVALAGCLWELSALLQQPTFEASSYAHPTISTLTDPLLAGLTGRSLVLAAWLALGWSLVRR